MGSVLPRPRLRRRNTSVKKSQVQPAPVEDTVSEVKKNTDDIISKWH